MAEINEKERRPRRLPPDPERMNDERATWAGEAIAAFQAETGTTDEALGDLICNLFHWADRNEVDWRAELRRAKAMYAEETGR